MNELPYFQEGSERTLLSASEANRIVGAINALRNIRGTDGIEVHVSDSGVVIKGVAGIKGDPGPPGTGGGGGGIAWGGEWSNAAAYDSDTVVIRSQLSDITGGDTAGTYISKIAVPAGNAPVPGGTTYWADFALDSHDITVLKNGTKKIELNVSATTPLFFIESSPSGARCVIDMTDLAGKEAKFREITVMESGACKKALVLMSATYV